MLKNLLLLLLLGVFACSKNEVLPTEDQSFNYISLLADRDTIFSGESCSIEANATGSNLKYNWSATAGDLLGSGEAVYYSASPCHAGVNTITCVISDGSNNSKSKSVVIVVQ